MNHSLANELKNNGFVIIRNVLSNEEIFQLRNVVNNHFPTKGIAHNHGLTQPNAAVEIPKINWLFYHSKILFTFRKLLGQEITFTSHCDVHSSTLSGWHKDDGMTVMDGGYFGFPAYKEQNCHVHKMAIYLQDHINNQGGLTVRKGSHIFPSFDRGEEVGLKTRKGDVIIFDVRLTHTDQRNPVPISQLQKPLNLAKRIANKIFKIEHK